MGERGWAGEPRRVRVVVAVLVAALAYGTVVHVVQLLAGAPDPYPLLPAWLTAYFVSLTVLDPVAAVLLARRRPGGPALASAVLVTDALANAYANYVLDRSDGVTAGRIGQAVISVLAVASVTTLGRGRRQS